MYIVYMNVPITYRKLGIFHFIRLYGNKQRVTQNRIENKNICTQHKSIIFMLNKFLITIIPVKVHSIHIVTYLTI